jgi:hypothetical protein
LIDTCFFGLGDVLLFFYFFFILNIPLLSYSVFKLYTRLVKAAFCSGQLLKAMLYRWSVASNCEHPPFDQNSRSKILQPVIHFKPQLAE